MNIISLHFWHFTSFRMCFSSFKIVYIRGSFEAFESFKKSFLLCLHFTPCGFISSKFLIWAPLKMYPCHSKSFGFIMICQYSISKQHLGMSSSKRCAETIIDEIKVNSIYFINSVEFLVLPGLYARDKFKKLIN